MKVVKYVFFFLLISNYCFSQARQTLKEIYNDQIDNTDYLDEFNNFDFSEVFTKTEEQSIHGVIGENHQRVRIKFIDLERNPNKKNEYIVYGKSKVKQNICEFKGKIVITNVFKVKALSYGVDDIYSGKIADQGFLIADYYFEENKLEPGTGIFTGKVYSKWCIFNKSKNKISYDNIDDHSDSYKNNAFIGVWKSYRSRKEKLCHWGDYRIPKINADFDVGACCFSPSKKYIENGWKNYSKANFENDAHAKHLESIKWWE